MSDGRAVFLKKSPLPLLSLSLCSCSPLAVSVSARVSSSSFHRSTSSSSSSSSSPSSTPPPPSLLRYNLPVMTSESLRPSQDSDRGHSHTAPHHHHHHHQRDSTPYAARQADLATTSRWFPLGYREGFSQWVCHPLYAAGSGRKDIRKKSRLAEIISLSSGLVCRLPRPNIKCFLSCLTCNANPPRSNRPVMSPSRPPAPRTTTLPPQIPARRVR